MVYPEYIRAQRVLRNTLIVVAAGTLIALIVLAFTRGHWGTVSFDNGQTITIAGHRHVGHGGGTMTLYEAMVAHGVNIPFAAMLGVAGVFAAIIATVLGTSLNRENSTLPSIWTKPAPRFRIALAYAGVDAVAILIAGALIIVVGGVSILGFLGILPLVSFGKGVPEALLMSAGFALAAYGVISALTSSNRRGGGVVAGLFWPVGLLLYGLMAVGLPTVLHDIIVAINFINPFAYLGTVSDKGAVSLLPVSLGARIGLIWLLALLTTSLSIYLWQRREV